MFQYFAFCYQVILITLWTLKPSIIVIYRSTMLDIWEHWPLVQRRSQFLLYYICGDRISSIMFSHRVLCHSHLATRSIFSSWKISHMNKAERTVSYDLTFLSPSFNNYQFMANLLWGLYEDYHNHLHFMAMNYFLISFHFFMATVSINIRLLRKEDLFTPPEK